MVETVLAPATALAHAPVDLPSRRVRLTPLAEGHVLQVVARHGATVPAERLAALGDGGSHAVRPNGPGQWLLVGDAALSFDEGRARAAAITDLAHVFDQSHGRLRIGLDGPGAEDLLATGIGVDLAHAAFPVGTSVNALFRHVSVHLTRTGADAFELVVPRSFAADLWHELGA
jgi:sarcosine oxidase subunit gamma